MNPTGLASSEQTHHLAPQPTLSSSTRPWHELPAQWATKTWSAALRWPAWVQVLVIYLLSRGVAGLFLVLTARHQTENYFGAARPSYWHFLTYWDGYWYRQIAENGYRQPIPVDPLTGVYHQSEWAFFPAFPGFVRMVMQTTGLSFDIAGPGLSTIFGAVAALLFFRLCRLKVGRLTSLIAVILWSFFPVSLVLQAAYTESLAFVGLFGAMYFLLRRQYLTGMAFAVLLGLTRPVAVPFAIVVLVHLIVRWVHRRRDPFPLGQMVGVVAMGLCTAAASVAWPLYVGWVTHDSGAYQKVQAAWHGGVMHSVTPWWKLARNLCGPTLGFVAIVVVLGTLCWAVLNRRSRTLLGPEMVAWVFAYVAYLVVVLQPFTSVFRYFYLLFPLAILSAAVVRSRAHLITWVAAECSLMMVWIAWLWHLRPPTDIPP